MPFLELRAVATRLHLRSQVTVDQNDEWARVIHAFWQSPAAAAPALAQLSPIARAALHQLQLAGSAPATLFFAEYGSIRRPGSTARGEPTPWRQPQTASEELYYAGLLHGEDAISIHRSVRIVVPHELELPAPAASSLPMADQSTVFMLLHDCAQVLLFQHQHAGERLQHGRWLSTAALHSLAQRSLHPDPPAASHKQSVWYAFLFFLCHAAELLDHGTVTPAGWAWLAQSDAQQLRQLWQGWQAAPPELRARYHQPIAHLPPPWPRILLRSFGCQVAPISAAHLSTQLMAASPDLRAYFNAHFADLQDAVQAVALLLNADLAYFGVVASSPAGKHALSLTALGAWLLHPALPPPPLLPDATVAYARLLPQTEARGGWSVRIPAQASWRALALLAPYVHDLPLDRHTSPPHHVVRFTADTVARAAAEGHGLAALLAALADLRIDLTPDDVATLHRAVERGQSLQLLHLPVLRTTTRRQMQEIRTQRHLDRLFGDLLSPTVSVLAETPAYVARQLARAGFAVAVPRAVEEEVSFDTPPGPPRSFPEGADGALWLAAHLYALVGQQMDLPMPPPFAAAETLFAQLSSAQQTVLQAWQLQIEERFASLLDGVAATPPPTPSDPARWRLLLESAIAAETPLAMGYFSAARNLLTRRVVEPYWIEERHATLYLRAYCHTAGRALTFRLDRIHSLEIAAGGELDHE